MLRPRMLAQLLDGSLWSAAAMLPLFRRLAAAVIPSEARNPSSNDIPKEMQDATTPFSVCIDC